MHYTMNIIKNSIRYFFKPQNILLLALAITFSIYITYSMMKNYISLKYTVSATDMLSKLYGIIPENEKTGVNANSLGKFLIMMLPFTIAIYIVSNYSITYVMQQIYFSSIRFKSLLKWFLSHFSVLIFCSILYFFIFNFCFYLVSGLITTFNTDSTYALRILGLTGQCGNMWSVIAVFSILQCSCIVVIVSVQYILSLLKGSFAGFSAGVVLIAMTILFNLFTNNNLYIKNIVLQKNIISNALNINSIIFILCLNIFSIVVILFIGYKLFSKMDLELKK